MIICLRKNNQKDTIESTKHFIYASFFFLSSVLKNDKTELNSVVFEC